METRKRVTRHYIDANGKDVFREWIDNLRDASGRHHILKRIDRLEEGKFGDHRHVAGGVWEMRIHHGPGYRVYYGEDGPIIVLLICGGDKDSQRKDIDKALNLWSYYGRTS